MATLPADVNMVHRPKPLVPEQLDLFPSVPPRLVSLENAPVLFPALTAAEYEPAGFTARLPHAEAA